MMDLNESLSTPPTNPSGMLLDEEEKYIITIDTRKLVPMKRYQLLKGLSQPRVSQLKNEGKLETRWIEFLEKEFVVLGTDEQELNLAMLKVEKPVADYTYRQMGNYFARTLLEYEKNLSAAERMSRQQQERANHYHYELQESERKYQELVEKCQALEIANQELASQKDKVEQDYTELQTENDAHIYQLEIAKHTIATLQEEKTGLTNQVLQFTTTVTSQTSEIEQSRQQEAKVKDRIIQLEKELATAQTKLDLQRQGNQDAQSLAQVVSQLSKVLENMQPNTGNGIADAGSEKKPKKVSSNKIT